MYYKIHTCNGSLLPHIQIKKKLKHQYRFFKKKTREKLLITISEY